MSTTEILKAHAPEFVELDRLEMRASRAPWKLRKSRWNCKGDTAFFLDVQGHEGVFSRPDALFVYEARWSARALLDFCAQLLVEREWRPIETAPKDGTRILAYSREEGVVVAECLNKDFIETGAWETDPCEPGWHIISLHPSVDIWYAPFDPTHWQPLPKPPGQREEASHA